MKIRSMQRRCDGYKYPRKRGICPDLIIKPAFNFIYPLRPDLEIFISVQLNHSIAELHCVYSPVIVPFPGGLGYCCSGTEKKRDCVAGIKSPYNTGISPIRLEVKGTIGCRTWFSLMRFSWNSG
jgi:hypothetical protein